MVLGSQLAGMTGVLQVLLCSVMRSVLELMLPTGLGFTSWFA
jgi:ABC-type uncharacterized transport system permease subunit